MQFHYGQAILNIKIENLNKGNANDGSSRECKEEMNSLYASYWQTCDFTAKKGAKCHIPVEFFHLLIVASIVFFVAALFSIFCFVKKRQNYRQHIADINYRLPHVYLEATNPAENQNEFILNGATPGLCIFGYF